MNRVVARSESCFRQKSLIKTLASTTQSNDMPVARLVCSRVAFPIRTDIRHAVREKQRMPPSTPRVSATM